MRKREHKIERLTDELMKFGSSYTYAEVKAMDEAHSSSQASQDGLQIGMCAQITAAIKFNRAGRQIFLFEETAEREIKRTEDRNHEAAYDFFPYEAAYIEVRNAAFAGFIACKHHETKTLALVPIRFDYENEYVTWSADDMSEWMNLAYYISAKNADINTVYTPPKGVRPNPKKRRSMATWHEVGYRIGAELREYERMASERKPHQGGTVRPHMRRAHWHHYWTGPLDGERELVLKWVAPTLVASKNGEITGATGHNVPVTPRG